MSYLWWSIWFSGSLRADEVLQSDKWHSKGVAVTRRRRKVPFLFYDRTFLHLPSSIVADTFIGRKSPATAASRHLFFRLNPSRTATLIEMIHYVRLNFIKMAISDSLREARRYPTIEDGTCGWRRAVQVVASRSSYGLTVPDRGVEGVAQVKTVSDHAGGAGASRALSTDAHA